MKKKLLAGLLVVTMLLGGCGSNIRDGVAYLEEGKYEEAIAAFEAQVTEEKQLDEAYRGIAIANFELENYKECVAYFEKALENEAEQTASMYYLMATSCMQYEDYENAVKNYDLVLGMEDCSEEMKKEVLFSRVVAYEKMLDWDSAREAVNEYLQLYPDDEQAAKEAGFLETR